VRRIVTGARVFSAVNYVFLSLVAFACLLPLLNVLAVSFSSSAPAAAGFVKLWPVQPTLASYEYALRKQEFLTSLLVSLKRVGIGVVVNLVLTVSIAYPLSRDRKSFRWRSVYAWFFIVTMWFQGGLIPTYMVIRRMGLMDSIWALILPNAVPVFNVILLMNFFRGLPKEIEEAAFIDGAGHWTQILKIYLPLSTPAIATVTLFMTVGHWNGWFDGLIYMNSPKNYPLQSYLRTIIVEQEMTMLTSSEMLQSMNEISDRTLKAAQVFLAALPILAVYPLLQRYFMKGLVIGSIKG
jgi:putative aldouronate transport system permease protein